MQSGVWLPVETDTLSAQILEYIVRMTENQERTLVRTLVILNAINSIKTYTLLTISN
jgi:hypothetical protein